MWNAQFSVNGTQETSYIIEGMGDGDESMRPMSVERRGDEDSTDVSISCGRSSTFTCKTPSYDQICQAIR